MNQLRFKIATLIGGVATIVAAAWGFGGNGDRSATLGILFLLLTTSFIFMHKKSADKENIPTKK